MKILPNSFKCGTTGSAQLAVQIMIRKLYSQGMKDFFVCIGNVVTPEGKYEHMWLENDRGTILDPVGACKFGPEGNTYEREMTMQPSNVIYEHLHCDLVLYIGNSSEREEIDKLLKVCPLKYLEKVGLA